MKEVLPSAIYAATGSAWNKYLDGGGTMYFDNHNNPGDPLVEALRTSEDQVPKAIDSIAKA